LRWGDYQPLDGVPSGLMAYTRIAGDDKLLAVLNFKTEPVDVLLPEDMRLTECLIGTHGEPPPSQLLALAANEARLLRLQ
jgi:hypothetical protein